MEGNYTKLSVRLYKILDAIGASEDVRELYRENATTCEILSSVFLNRKISEYRFGSSYEGTTTNGLKSDLDVLHCFEHLPVVEKIEDAPEYGMSLLMISDAETKPGYFKLQIVHKRRPLTIYQLEMSSAIAKILDTDILGRLCYRHVSSRKPGLERNGPAYSEAGQNGIIDKDFVDAFRCQKIPETTYAWLNRVRICNWPSKPQLHKMKALGCFFVGVSHSKAQNKHIEWRISFSLQERELMASLNQTQHKCYILLKMIKKDIIQPKAGDKSISSYHCKTCLFHVLENSRPGLWTRGNLVQGVRVCLAVLLNWVRKGNCPNFFVPEENMFDRLDRNTLDRIDRILTDLLKSRASFLLSLHCDNIGTYISEENLILSSIKGTEAIYHLKYLNITNVQYKNRNDYLQSVGRIKESKQCLAKLCSLYHYFTTVDMVKDRSSNDVRMVIQSMLSYFHLQIAQSIASTMYSESEVNCHTAMLRAFVHSIGKSENCDLISSDLILATCFLQADMLNKTEEILLNCETCLEIFVISVCGCYSKQLYKNEALTSLFSRFQLSNKEFRWKCTTGCLLFLPAQANLVHPALQLELYRSVYTPPGSRDEYTDNWFDWILVDSRLYLYFLQYLLYSKTNNEVRKIDAINSLIHLINTDGNLGHRETACNLLGWIMIREKRLNDALRCLQKSWYIRPVHNAAKWHVCVILARVRRQNQSR